MIGKTNMKASGVEWIGQIPEGWEVVPTYVYLKETNRKNVGLQEKNVLSLSYGNIISKDVGDNMGLIPASYETYQIVESGQIVFRLTDLQNDKRSLRNGIVRERGIITSAYVAIQTINGCLSDYYNYLFRAYDTTKVLYTLGSGVRQSSDYSELKRLPVIVPPTETQQRIVDFLDERTGEIDRVIEKKKRMIELLKEKRTAVITHAVTKGLDPNTKMKASGVEWIGQIPEGWEVVPLYKFFDISKIKIKDGVVPALSVGYMGVVPQLEDAAKNLAGGERKHVQSGDLAINSRSDRMGAGGLATQEGGVSLVYHVLRPRCEVNGRFFHYVIRNVMFSQEFYRRGNGIVADLWSTKDSELKCISVPVPPTETQQRIVDFLDERTGEIDDIIQLLKKQISKLSELRTSLIYHAVTGKMPV